MRDPLEQYILDQKQALDVYEPDDRLWERIDKELYASSGTSGRKVVMLSLWKIVAGFALIISLGITLWFLKPSTPAGQAMSSQESTAVQPQDLYSAELVEVEAYYTAMITTQKEQIKAYKAAGISIDDNMFNQLEELTSQYKELQQELLAAEDVQMIISAMIQNLSLQMEVLSQQLMILEQIKSMQHEHETSL